MAAVKSRHHLSFEENVAAIKKNTSGTSVLTISDEFNGGNWICNLCNYQCVSAS